MTSAQARPIIPWRSRMRWRLWHAWLRERPAHIRAVAERLPPWIDYQFVNSKRLCTIYSYEEYDDERVTLKVLQPDIIGLPVSDLVFGVAADDIEPADENCVRPLFHKSRVHVVESVGPMLTLVHEGAKP